MQLHLAKTLTPTGALSGFEHRPEDAKWFEAIPGERISIRVNSDQVGGRFSIMESISAPGSAAPLHAHKEDEVFQVLQGYPTFALGDRIFNAKPGSLVVIPAGTPHAWKNRTSLNVRMLATFTPGGVEELFTRIAGLSPEQIAEVAAEYETVVLGPPIQD